MQINLPIAVYKFCFRAIDPVSLPAIPDPLWRSVFGLALRKLRCTSDSKQVCASCPRQNRCEYAALLCPVVSAGKSVVSYRMREKPSPLIFQSRIATYSTAVPPGSVFFLGIVLVGTGNRHLASVIKAMALAGSLGLGKKRAKFQLAEVLQVGRQQPPSIIMNNGSVHRHGRAAFIPIPPVVAVVRCTFVTPYLLPSNTRLDDGFDHVRFLMQIVRRVTSLYSAYAGEDIKADFTAIKKYAQHVGITDVGLTVQTKYSFHSSTKKFSAVRGAFILDLSQSRDLWPWLWYGQWLHVPKLPGKGFGRYELALVEE